MKYRLLIGFAMSSMAAIPIMRIGHPKKSMNFSYFRIDKGTQPCIYVLYNVYIMNRYYLNIVQIFSGISSR